jgi:phosphonate transport system permease protein
LRRAAPAPPKPGARVLALLVDALLVATFLLMGEFLVRALVFPVEDGALRTAQELLERLHYAALGGAGLVLAAAWNAADRILGGTPGQSFAGALPEEKEGVPWDRTLRGWFTLLFVELTFFTGWLVTEVDLRTFFTNFDKAAGVINGLLHPSTAVLFEGLILLVQTLFLAFMATAFAIPPAFVLAFAAARNLTRESRSAKLVYTALRTAMNLTRAVEPLVWALVFISWVGIGPFAGVLALWVHSVASLVKLYSEQIESIDRGPMDAIKATGAGTLQVLRYGVVPQVIPPFLSFTIYRWDINVRMSTIIGFVGGGGIGYILKPRVDLGEWGEVGTLVLLIAATVWVMDILSAKIRERIV